MFCFVQKFCTYFRFRGGSCFVFYATTQFAWRPALGSAFSPCPGSAPSQQLANCFQINLSPCLVFTAPLRSSPCLVPLLSLPLLLCTLHEHLQTPSRWWEFLQFLPLLPNVRHHWDSRLPRKQMASFGLNLPCDFLPFLFKNLGSPKYPHGHPGFSFLLNRHGSTGWSNIPCLLSCEAGVA